MGVQIIGRCASQKGNVMLYIARDLETGQISTLRTWKVDEIKDQSWIKCKWTILSSQTGSVVSQMQLQF